MGRGRRALKAEPRGGFLIRKGGGRGEGEGSRGRCAWRGRRDSLFRRESCGCACERGAARGGRVRGELKSERRVSFRVCLNGVSRVGEEMDGRVAGLGGGVFAVFSMFFLSEMLKIVS